MADFTPEQIADARENPRPGDEWIKGVWRRMVCEGGKALLVTEWGKPKSGFSTRTLLPWPSQFYNWTSNATLVRRGDA